MEELDNLIREKAALEKKLRDFYHKAELIANDEQYENGFTKTYELLRELLDDMTS